MDDLRWALLGLGLLFVGGLAWWELRKPRHAASDEDSGATSPPAAMSDGPAARRVEPRFDDSAQPAAAEPEFPSMRALEVGADPPVIVIGERRGSAPTEGFSIAADVAVDSPGAVRDEGPDAEPDEPWIAERSLAEAGALTEEHAMSAAEPPLQPAATVAVREAQRKPPEPDWPPEDRRRIVSLRVAPRPPNRFGGRTLRQAFNACGLEYGGLDIFHLVDDQGSVFASAANLMRPGTFNLETMDGQFFHGVHLFCVLPGPLPAGRAVDELVALARDLAQRLAGMVLDEVGQPLHEERAAELRAAAVEGERAG
jgi:hypothetical protein